ncbi:hypothetical protein WBP06_04110 [Novosphingobium sp. BL-8H]|uniref:hypothetical protein n=1 Tax=Novosphingobium sp. BL-8H TaxID=3127640 RepID=UPI0037568D96
MNIKVAAVLSMAVVFASGTSACSHDASGDTAINERASVTSVDAPTASMQRFHLEIGKGQSKRIQALALR